MSPRDEDRSGRVAWEGARPEPAAPAQTDADVLVRRALQDLVDAHEEGRPGGLSQSEMARACGVSRQQVARILAGERRLHPGQIARLPQRAYDAVTSAIAAARRAARPAAPRTPESRTRQLGSLLGRHNELVERAYADGRIDATEAAALRASLRDLEAAAAAGPADVDAALRLVARESSR